MKEVYLINPTTRKKRKKSVKKSATTTKPRAKKRAKRATTKRRVVKKATMSIKRQTTAGVSTMAKKRKKRSYKKNPSPPRRRSRPARSYKKRAISRVRSTFSGLNFKGALKNIPYAQFGMFGAKFLAKKFGGGALEADPESWTWKQYLQGGLGAAAAGFLAQMIKPGSGQRVLEGGLNLIVYEMIQNELITGSEWATEQFGEDEGEEDYSYQPGDVESDETGKTYLLGEDYAWRELPEADVSGMGRLEPVGPLGRLEPVGPLGGTTDVYRSALLDT